MKVEWLVAIVLVSFLGFGCNQLMPNSPEVELLQEQLATAKDGIANLQAALANGESLSEATKASILAQIETLKKQQDEIEKLIAGKLEEAGIPPELAAGGGGLGAALIAWLISLAKKSIGTANKLKSTRADLYGRVTALEGTGATPAASGGGSLST
jgi:hypothetical protein